MVRPTGVVINTHEKYQVEYWTKALGVSEEKLKELVAKYGVVAVNVRGCAAHVDKAISPLLHDTEYFPQ